MQQTVFLGSVIQLFASVSQKGFFMVRYLLIGYAAASLLAFFAYRSDKRRAKRHRWRRSEYSLLTVGFLGGAVGALLGMKAFRHKTKHWYFWLVNFAGLLWQTAAVIVCLLIER